MNIKIKYYWPLLILGLVFILLSVVFLVPTIMKIIKVNNDLEVIKKKAGQMAKKYDDLSKIDRNDITEKTQKLNYYLPSSKDVSILLDTVNSLTAETGIFFETMSLAPGEISTPSAAVKKTSTEEISPMDISLTLSGDFKSLVNFIKKAKSASPVIRVRNISVLHKLNVLDLEVSRPYSYSIVVTTYFQALPKALEGVAVPIKVLSDEENILLESLSVPPKSTGIVNDTFRGTKTDPFSKF